VHTVRRVYLARALLLLDGERREYLRKGDEVQCLLPDAKRIIVEKRPLGSNFPALSNRRRLRSCVFTTCARGFVERVADAECQSSCSSRKMACGTATALGRAHDRVAAARADAQRTPDVIEQMAFTEVRIGEVADPSRLKPSWSTEGWRIDKVEKKSVDLPWSLLSQRLFATERRHPSICGRNGRDTVQAVYSDGLATFSVFIEPDQGGAGQALRSPRVP